MGEEQREILVSEKSFISLESSCSGVGSDICLGNSPSY